MILSPKRSHVTLEGSNTTKSDALAVGAKLADSLSISLHELLTNHVGRSSKSDETESSHQDIYHKYLNSPPLNDSTDPSRYESEKQWKERAEQWLSSAMATVGVGSNINAIKFWREHGEDNDESFADGRYMVWLAKEILFGLAIEGAVPNKDGSDDHDGSSPDYDDYHPGDHLIGVLDNWHQSTMQLLSKTGAKIYDTDTVVEEEYYDAAGVMWQMLLQKASLSPDSLRDYFDEYSYSQDRCEQNPFRLYFELPSFFRFATVEAAGVDSQDHGGCMNQSNKRRKSNRPEVLSVGGVPKSIAWLPLLGYSVAYSFLSSPINTTLTADEQIRFLKENICASLPPMMSISNYYNTKKSILSGIVACVVDELGEWIVLDGLELGDDDRACLREERMHEELRARASVSEIVDMLLVDAGILANLANLTSTPLANLVAEIADAILNYSVVYNRLRLPLKSNQDQDDESDNSYLPQHNYIIHDAQHVVDFMDKTNPQLKHQLMNRKFISGQYFSSTGSRSAPPHPIVIYTRALLTSNRLPEASKLSRILEDCSGIDDSSKRHCYFLLFENMHDNGVLFEDGWNDNAGGATLANICVGALGRKCALDYLANVVLEAKENLLSNLSLSRNHKKRAEHEMLCVKDAVRRTVLKFLLPRAYSTNEALVIATSLSDAKNDPQLENVVWGANDSNSLAHQILAARSLYSSWNEYIIGEEGDNIFQKDESPTQVENMDAEGSSQPKRTTAEPINNELAQKNYQMCGVDNIDHTRKKDKETYNSVIDLEHSDSSSALGTESIEDNKNDDEECGVSYPRHTRQYTGNYSESDDYEVEDEIEAKAFKGEDDETPEDYTIEILSSQDEDEDEEDNEDENEEDEEEDDDGDDVEDEEEYDASSVEELNETNIINEAAENLSAKNKNSEIEEEGYSESDEDKFIDGRVLPEAVHQFIIPATTEKRCQTMDDQVRGNEKEAAIKEQSGRHNEGRLVDDMIEVKAELLGNHCLGTGVLERNERANIETSLTPGTEDANEEVLDDVNDIEECPHNLLQQTMQKTKKERDKTEQVDEEVTEGQLQFNEDAFEDNETSSDDDTTETDGIIMADDEQSIDTEEDKRIYAEASIDTEDEKRDDQVDLQEEQMVDGADGVKEGTPLFDESEVDHGKPSVLVVAAISCQRQGSKQIESHSKYVRENYGNTSQGDSMDIDKSCSVQVDAKYLDNAHSYSDHNGEDSSTKLAEETGHTDDGYVPDAEVTEEECGTREQNETARTIRYLDGYIPDAELTEEERPEKMKKTEEEGAAAPRLTENTSIDEGYVPDDTLTEEERGEIISTQNINAGYFPDGPTTLQEVEVGGDNNYYNPATMDACIPSVQKASDDDSRASLLGGDTQEDDREDAIMRSDFVATPNIFQQDQSDPAAQEFEFATETSLRLRDTNEIADNESFSVDSGEIRISDLSLIVDERSFKNDFIGQHTSMSEIECAVTTPKDSRISERGDAAVEAEVDTDGREVEREPAFLLEHATNAEATVTLDTNADTTQLTTKNILSHISEVSKLNNVVESVTVAGDKTIQHDDREDISRWTFMELREKLYELNVPIKKGWRKKDLVKCVQNHLDNRPILEDVQGADNYYADVGEDFLKSKAASVSFKQDNASASISSTPKPKSPSSSGRRSTRDKTRSLKAALIQVVRDTPISELSKSAHSELDDDSLQEQNSTPNTEHSGPSPGVPTTITTRRLRVNKHPSLPVVPEGVIVEGATADAKAVEMVAETEVSETDQKVKSLKATQKSASSKKSSSLKRKENESASSDSSFTSRTRSKTTVIDNSNATKAPKLGVRSTRASSTKLEQNQLPPKRESDRSKKKVDEVNSIVSTRRSTRILASSTNDSASTGTRRSSRRAKN